jgi:formylglycine-generating enzyme required for sulfatase activity
MRNWDRQVNLHFRGWRWIAAALGVVVILWAVVLGTRARREPNRCAPGFEALGARCCAPGQALSAGKCVGMPSRCPAPFELIRDPTPGCVFPSQKIVVAGGSVTLGPTDWDSVEVVKRTTVAVRPFSIDQTEVTHAQFESCVRAGLCTTFSAPDDVEPGAPVTGIAPAAAAEYCAYLAGRLPTPAEWIFAASGQEARRFPWGAHGLVCRRAAFGLVDGPCAEEGIYPDLAGTHPDGASPAGALDLAGNVSEWTVDESGAASVRGGSFRAKTAGELKVWSSESAQVADDVGFRCVYPAP